MNRNKEVFFMIGSGVYPEVVGGMEVFNYYLIEGLAEMGCKVSYLSTSEYAHKKGHHLKYWKLRPTKYLAPLQLFICLLFHPSFKKVVISYSSAHWVLWYLYMASVRLLHREYIVVAHYGDKPPQSKYKVYSRFFSKASTVVVVSDDIKKNYDSFFGIDCKVIYPLVPFSKSEKAKSDIRLEYDIPTDACVISMVGSIKPMKNPDTILRALASFSEEEIVRYNPYVVYAGKGESVGELKGLAQQLGLSDRVKFLGFVPKEKVNEIMKLSDLYLIASDFEGTSVSLTEAMFNGLPILASRAPGIVNTVNENTDCLMFETKNVRELKEKLILLLSNSALRAELSNQVVKSFEAKYDFQRTLDAYCSIL